MNFVSSQTEIRRTTKAIQLTQVTDMQSSQYQSNYLEGSNISQSQVSKTSLVQNTLKPTRSKALISSYLHSMLRQKTISEEKGVQKQSDKKKSLAKNTAQKLSLISNVVIDKQNKASRANSKQKLHLTTLHPNIPSLLLSSKLQQNKQNLNSQRDMFWNISITNQSQNTRREQLQYKQKVITLQSQLQSANSNVNLIRMTLQSRQKRLEQSEQEIKEMKKKYALLELQYQQLKHCQKSIQDQTKEKRLFELKIKQQHQSTMRQRNQKTNQVILNYESQITELQHQFQTIKKDRDILKQDVEQLKLHGNLQNINTNKIIRQLQMQKQTLQNLIKINEQNTQHQINCLKQNILKIQEECFTLKQNKTHLQNTLAYYTQTIGTYEKQRSSNIENSQRMNKLTNYSEQLKFNYERLENKNLELTNIILEKQKKQKQNNLISQSIKKQNIQYKETLQTLTQRLQRSNKELHSIASDRESLAYKIEHYKNQNQILKKQLVESKQLNNTLQLKVETYHRSLQQSINIDQTFLRRLQINTSIRGQNQVYHQIQRKINDLQTENRHMKIEFQSLLKQKRTNQELIIRIEQSIQQKIRDQQMKFSRQYQQLQQKYLIVSQKLEKIYRKRNMQKNLISESNNFHEQIFLKCKQIYNTTNS